MNLTLGMETKKMKTKRKLPDVIFHGGKPTAVILDIHEYRKMLERLEDAADLKMLEAMRKKPLKYRRLEDFLKAEVSGV